MAKRAKIAPVLPFISDYSSFCQAILLKNVACSTHFVIRQQSLFSQRDVRERGKDGRRGKTA
jgi:hypothetical protein